MLTNCLKCKKNTKNIDAKMIKTKNGRFTLSSSCAVYGSKKSKLLKEQEAEELLSNLGIKTPLSKNPLLNVLYYIPNKKRDKACFQHYKAYGDFKDLQRRTQSDKFLKYKVFAIGSNRKYDRYQRALASMVYKCFDKTSKGAGIKNEIKENQQLANELHKPFISKLKKKQKFILLLNTIFGVLRFS